ncbi:chemotaxis protein cheY [Haloferula helveola]|uniref:Chemotaxis protein cheY n=1 Tax=Haloferula helveola TaxID=490095 RepID=A0ABM7RS06_9BACT|nr:chemotaxis protein cheY [Haloferula helveola]
MYRLPDNPRAEERSGKRILVVDDEPTLRLGFAYALTNENTVAETAANGAEALDRLHEKQYDAVVLDLRMPEVDGLSVIQRMRSEGIKTPVVLCSAFITLHSALIAIQNQVVDFLMKPVRPRDLRQAVAAVLGMDESPLGVALAAARESGLDDAIRTLEGREPTPGTSEHAWLRVLTTLREHQGDPGGAESELTDRLLDLLAFRPGD